MLSLYVHFQPRYLSLHTVYINTLKRGVNLNSIYMLM